MGNNHDRWYGKQKRKVILIGLENAGKTVLFEFIKTKEFMPDTLPTNDINIETIKYDKKHKLILFDLAGGERQRIFWRHNFEGTQGVIFIIDGFDESKFEASKKELITVIYEKVLKDAAILIIVNKSDKIKEDLDFYIKKFALKEILSNESQRIKIIKGSLMKKEGINEGLDWLMKTMKAL